jgi:hypothetical protein
LAHRHLEWHYLEIDVRVLRCSRGQYQRAARNAEGLADTHHAGRGVRPAQRISVSAPALEIIRSLAGITLQAYTREDGRARLPARREHRQL